MAFTLNPTLAERVAYPYAVGVRLPDESRTTYTHFDSKTAARFFADIMDTSQNIVTRWVAVVEPEYLIGTPVSGWRQVTYFN